MISATLLCEVTARTNATFSYPSARKIILRVFWVKEDRGDSLIYQETRERVDEWSQSVHVAYNLVKTWYGTPNNFQDTVEHSIRKGNGRAIIVLYKTDPQLVPY